MLEKHQDQIHRLVLKLRLDLAKIRRAELSIVVQLVEAKQYVERFTQPGVEAPIQIKLLQEEAEASLEIGRSILAELLPVVLTENDVVVPREELLARTSGGRREDGQTTPIGNSVVKGGT